jgi:hypothetical protein
VSSCAAGRTRESSVKVPCAVEERRMPVMAPTMRALFNVDSAGLGDGSSAYKLCKVRDDIGVRRCSTRLLAGTFTMVKRQLFFRMHQNSGTKAQELSVDPLPRFTLEEAEEVGPSEELVVKWLSWRRKRSRDVDDDGGVGCPRELWLSTCTCGDTISTCFREFVAS